MPAPVSPVTVTQTIEIYNTTDLIERDKGIYFQPLTPLSADDDDGAVTVYDWYEEHFRSQATLVYPQGAQSSYTISRWMPDDRTLKIVGDVTLYRNLQKGATYLLLCRIINHSTDGYYGYFITDVTQTGTNTIELSLEPDTFTNYFFWNNVTIIHEGDLPTPSSMLSKTYIERQHYNRFDHDDETIPNIAITLKQNEVFCNNPEKFDFRILGRVEHSPMYYDFTTKKIKNLSKMSWTRIKNYAVNNVHWNDIQASDRKIMLSLSLSFLYVMTKERINTPFIENIFIGPKGYFPPPEIHGPSLYLHAGYNISRFFAYPKTRDVHHDFPIYIFPVMDVPVELKPYTNEIASRCDVIYNIKYKRNVPVDFLPQIPTCNIETTSTNEELINFYTLDGAMRELRDRGFGPYILFACLNKYSDLLSELTLEGDQFHFSNNYEIDERHFVYPKQWLNNTPIPVDQYALYNTWKTEKLTIGGWQDVGVPHVPSLLSPFTDAGTTTQSVLTTILKSAEMVGKGTSTSAEFNMKDGFGVMSMPVLKNNGTGEYREFGWDTAASEYRFIFPDHRSLNTRPLYCFIPGRNESLKIKTYIDRLCYLVRENYVQTELIDPILECYPYRFYSISFMGVAEIELQTVYFMQDGFHQIDECELWYVDSLNDNLKVNIIPLYKIFGFKSPYYNMALTYSINTSFPISSDSYMAYYYQNMAMMKNQYAMNTLQAEESAIKHFLTSGPARVAAAPIKTNNPYGALAQGIIETGDVLDIGVDYYYNEQRIRLTQEAKLEDMGRRPDVLKNLGSDVFGDMLINENRLYFNEYRIDDASYKSIALYLEKYGYMVRRFDTMDCTSRRAWNYVKLISFDFKQHVSLDNAATITKILRDGVIFVHDRTLYATIDANSAERNYEVVLDSL